MNLPRLRRFAACILQISTDIDAGIECGDMGRLYLSARRQDLTARRFDQCWMVMQCH
jgi:hypothetical protein